MKNKYIFFVFLFLITLLVKAIFISQNCKPVIPFIFENKLNKSTFNICINSVAMKENIQSILIKNKYLYNFAYNIKNKYFPKFGKKNLFEDKNKQLENIEQVYFKKKNDIKGIINNEKILKELSIEKKPGYKFNTWLRSHGNNQNNKYFETLDINKNNLDNLELIYQFDTLKNPYLKNIWESRIGINPIFAEDKIFFVSASWELIALSAKDFSMIWSKDFNSSISKRGFLYHSDKKEKQNSLLINSGGKLYKINPKNGELVEKFGDLGSVDVGVVLIPPVVYKDQIIISNVSEGKIISVNLRTGKKEFVENLHKKENFYFYANPWGGAALDEKNGIYFVVTGNPKPSIVGIDRPGENKNSCSIIAFDLNKKKIMWVFQDVIHDLWDFDLAAPPILADVKIKNFILEVVILTSKTGNTYVFERKTGKSVFDIKYKKTIKSNLPNEFVAPFQPEPLLPKKFSKIEFKKSDLRKNLLANEEFMNYFDKNHAYGWFQPPLLGKDIVFYGIKGGNNWVGSAYNPKTQTLYIPSNQVPYKIKTFVKSREKKTFAENLNNYNIYEQKCLSCHGSRRNGVYEKFKGSDIQKNYIPSLVGISVFNELKGKMSSYQQIIQMHDNKMNLTLEEFKKIKNLFTEWDESLKNNKLMYFDGVWEEFFAQDGKLISSPPWGKITSIKIDNGKTNWSVPFGVENGKNIGLFNYGGLSITSSNLLIATGTVDNYSFYPSIH